MSGDQPIRQRIASPGGLGDYLFGLGTALAFASSSIFVRRGLEDLPSPVLGVTIGMLVAVGAYGVGLLTRQRRDKHPVPVSGMTLIFQILAGIFIGLGTWARYIAMDLTPVAIVLAIGRINVPLVLLLSPWFIGRLQERVSPKVWFGAALIIAGSLLLIFYG